MSLRDKLFHRKSMIWENSTQSMKETGHNIACQNDGCSYLTSQVCPLHVYVIDGNRDQQKDTLLVICSIIVPLNPCYHTWNTYSSRINWNWTRLQWFASRERVVIVNTLVSYVQLHGQSTIRMLTLSCLDVMRQIQFAMELPSLLGVTSTSRASIFQGQILLTIDGLLSRFPAGIGKDIQAARMLLCSIQLCFQRWSTKWPCSKHSRQQSSL